MSDTIAKLRHKIDSAQDLRGVVRTMKAIAASSISQYETSVLALADYYRTIEFGLGACFREADANVYTGKNASLISKVSPKSGSKQVTCALVFGSDQGLVGQFNEDIRDFAINALKHIDGKPLIWAIGERVHSRLVEANQNVLEGLSAPTSVGAIAELVGHLQVASQAQVLHPENTVMYVFYNQSAKTTLYQPVSQRLLPLDKEWHDKLAKQPWPTSIRPEIIGTNSETAGALVREYIFISLFRACAESLASENASRLAAMQRAEKNIDDLLSTLGQEFHRLRQNSIDAELSDVLAGYEQVVK